MRTFMCLLAMLTASDGRAGTPVIFLPGTGGSTLRFADSGRLYWLDEDVLGRDFLLRGRLNPEQSGPERPIVVGEVLDQVTHEGLRCIMGRLERLAREGDIPELERLLVRVPDGAPVYSSFLRWARKEFAAAGWYEAPYDWRLRPSDNMAALDRVVERARRETKSDQVILLGHSQGGLVAREYLASVGKGKVRALIAVGTPWLGTPQAARAVFLGHDLGLGVTLPDRLPKLGRVPEVRARVNDLAFGPRNVWFPLRLSLARGEDTRALATTFPTMFLMIPAPAHAAHLAALLDPSAAGRMNVVAEWSPREFEQRVAVANRPAAEWAVRWRKEY